METRDGDRLQKPRKESAGGSWEIADEPAQARPELLSGEEKTPLADETQDKPRHANPIHRKSVFNRAVKRRSRGNAGDASGPRPGHLAGQSQGQLSQLLLDMHSGPSGRKGPR